MPDKKIIIEEDQMLMKFTQEELELKNKTIKQLRKFWKENDYSSIINLAEKAIVDLPNKPLGIGDNDMSEIYFLLASAIKEIAPNDKNIKRYALLSAKFNRLSKNSMWLIREINNQYSKNSKLMRLQVLGDFFFRNKNEEIRQPFKTIYSVVAENKDEAMKYIKEFERKEVISTLRIDKFYEYDAKPELPKGVYETMKLFTWLDKKDTLKPN